MNCKIYFLFNICYIHNVISVCLHVIFSQLNMWSFQVKIYAINLELLSERTSFV